MSPAVPPAVTNFTALGTNLSVSSGSTASFLWPVLLANRTYNWYVTVTDASDHTVTSPVWRFTTQPAQGSVLASDFALQMNGAYSYADLSRATTNLASVGDFTISGWFKIGNNGSTESPGQYLFRITNQESNTRRIQITETNGTITADIRATAAGAVYAVSSSAFSYDTWVHVAFVREGTQLRLYLNGQQVASRTAVITPLVVNRWAFLGANTYNSGIWGVPSNGFLGAIDEFQIWTVARTAQDIQNSMYRVIATAPGLFARWGFNEGTGTLAVDSSGNNGTATVNSAVWTRSMWEPVLHFTSDGARTTLSWDSAAAQLEAASSVTGPWSVPTGATSPYVVDRALNPKRFFRLRLGN
jgi:hypothetical protein